jgi:heat-inducible transcriptional repressor
VITPAERYGLVELQQAANYLNTEFRGRSMVDVRHTILERLREVETLYDALMERALKLANSTFEGMVHAPNVYIQGASLLLDDVDAEYAAETLQALRTLLQMIDEKAKLVQLLDEYLSGAGLTVVIGSEHQAPDLRSFSIVTATYNDGRGTGAVGVIGPTRMRYSRAINAVDSLARAINRVVRPDA